MFRSSARAGLGRLITPSTWAPARRSYSTSTSSPASNAIKYTVIAGATGLSGAWWLSTRQDVPQLDTPPVQQLVTEPGPSKYEVSRLLSEGAYSFAVRDVSGITRYDGTQLASNSPCEDRFVHGKFRSPWNDGSNWMAWAVFDGHAGWQTAELLQHQLVPFVRQRLSQVTSAPGNLPIPEKDVQRAIVDAFLDLDDSIIKAALKVPDSNEPLQDKVKKLMPGYAGSCALLSMYDPAASTLHVACTGDSRAVLGQLGSDGKWEAVPLSVDQTGSNEEEIARLSKEHPGEENIAKKGRVLGIMVSRAFGDGRWKWPVEFQQDVKQRFGGPTPLTSRYDIRTPPYLTAEPVVVSTKINPQRPSFLILATDGMWDNVSSQQAVDLVGRWLEARAGKAINKPEPTYQPFDLGQFENGTEYKFVEERTTTQDKNAAVHLVRNSLGGNHHEMLAGRLAFNNPFSREIRDDVTVQVVFFNSPTLGK